jgi:hypothetical protein
MMSVSSTRSAPLDDHQHLRLRLKPRGAVTGYVDGAWWPRSRDLPAELPALVAVLAIRMGPVESVSYNLDAWGTTPRKIRLDGRFVRLAGYASQHPATIDVISAGHRITLLVVPPDATPQAAHGTLMAAGRRANSDRVEALLLAGDAYSTDAAEEVAQEEVAQQGWDLDGGPARMRSAGVRLLHTPSS